MNWTRSRSAACLLQREPAIERAEQQFRRAISIARERDAKSFELRATIALARVLGQSGRGAEARAALQPVHDWFAEGFEMADLVAARALLRAH